MSQQNITVVDQAKAESKKLLKLALQDAGIIKISKLSEAQELIARIKGKANWHEFMHSDTAQLKAKEDESLANTSWADEFPTHWVNYIRSKPNLFHAYDDSTALHILRPDNAFGEVWKDEDAERLLKSVPESAVFVLVDGFTPLETGTISRAYQRGQAKHYEIGVGRVRLEYALDAKSVEPMDQISFQHEFIAQLGMPGLIRYYPETGSQKSGIFDFTGWHKGGSNSHRFYNEDDLTRLLTEPLVYSPLTGEFPPKNLPWHQYAFLALLMGEYADVDCRELHYLMATSSDKEAILDAAVRVMAIPKVGYNWSIPSRMGKHAFFGTLILSFADGLADKEKYVRGCFEHFNPLLARMFKDFSGDRFLVDSSGVVAHYFSEVAEKQALKTPAVGQAFNRILENLLDYANWKIGELGPRIELYIKSEAPRNFHMQPLMSTLYKRADSKIPVFPEPSRIDAVLETGTAHQIASVLKRLFDLCWDAKDDKNNMWLGRSLSLLSVINHAVIPELVKARDGSGFLPRQKRKLNIKSLMEAMSLQELVNLHKRNSGSQDYNDQPLKAYLHMIPELDISDSPDQLNETALEQHGYCLANLLHMFDQLEAVQD